MDAPSWLLPSLSLLGGILGGLFGGYWSKRGEIRAVHAELGKLVEQNKAITVATEEIKASMSTEAWRRDIKKDACYGLLRQLQPIGRAMSKLAAKHTRQTPELIQEAQAEFVTAFGSLP